MTTLQRRDGRFRSLKSTFALALLSIALLTLNSFIHAAEGTLPDRGYDQSELFKRISPQMTTLHLNQPEVVNGYVLLAGNAVHEFWDISDPYNPVSLSRFQSPHRNGEAESIRPRLRAMKMAVCML